MPAGSSSLRKQKKEVQEWLCSFSATSASFCQGLCSAEIWACCPDLLRCCEAWVPIAGVGTSLSPPLPARLHAAHTQAWVCIVRPPVLTTCFLVQDKQAETLVETHPNPPPSEATEQLREGEMGRQLVDGLIPTPCVIMGWPHRPSHFLSSLAT